MGRPDYQRATATSTVREYERGLNGLFPGIGVATVQMDEARELARRFPPLREIADGSNERELVCFVGGSQAEPTFATTLDFGRPWRNNERLLAKAYTRVFASDLVAAPSVGRDSDTWISLQQTRMIRTIARLTTFNTAFFIRCLRMTEGAREHTYEGQAYATSLFLTTRLSHIVKAAGAGFIRLRSYMPMGTALLGEKWVRALTMDGSVALVASAKDEVVSGVVVVPSGASPLDGCLPTGLAHLEQMVTGGIALIAATQIGDVWVRLSNRMAFLRRRSRWQFFDIDRLFHELELHVDRPLAATLARMAVDASFERRGSLLGVLADPDDVGAIVPDHRRGKRSNLSLREIVSGLSVMNPQDALLVRSSSQVDGATILTREGLVLDTACMVRDPAPEHLEKLGLQSWPSMPGARSTAARTCSLFGLAIKVSDDGPISVFAGGALRLEMG